MSQTPVVETPSRRGSWPLLLWVVPQTLMMVGLLVSLAFDVPLAGDPQVFQARIASIEAGGIPYVDPVYEHLPGMIIPMYAARVLGGLDDAIPYTLAFGVLMAVCISLTTIALERSDAVYGHHVARVWLLTIAPLLVFVTFRNDPWSVLLAVYALLSLGRGGALAGGLAILSKAWPAPLIAIEWHRRRKRIGITYAALSVIALAFMASDGFRATQAAAGLHAETLVGSLTGLIRSLAGHDLGIEFTTAVYLTVHPGMKFVGPLFALIIAAAGVFRLHRHTDLRGEALAMAVLVIAVIIASPLFSSQYVLWLAPFTAFSRLRYLPVIQLLVSILALSSLMAFDALFDGSIWWWAGAVGRNILMVAVAIALLKELGRSRYPSDAGCRGGVDADGLPRSVDARE